jgi:hypothetical protein
MKQNKILIAFALLILTGALYRIIPGRPFGFAPQIAMALFGGAIISDKKWAFALPLFSLFISDALYEVLYRSGLSTMAGFYEGQGVNYLLLAGITFIGIGMSRINLTNIALSSVAAPVLFFLTSNFATWAGHGGYNLPMTGEGLFPDICLWSAVLLYVIDLDRDLQRRSFWRLVCVERSSERALLCNSRLFIF